MKTIILLALLFICTKSHAQTGWYDEEQEKIPNHFAKYDTTVLYLFNPSLFQLDSNNTSGIIQKVFKITKHTHYFPAVTIKGSPVYWTTWWRIVNSSFQTLEKEGILLQQINDIKNE